MIGYGMQAVAAVQLYATFAIWMIAGWLIVGRVKIAPHHGPAVLAATAILAPIALAHLLVAVFWVVPGINPTLCLVIVTTVPVVVIAIRVKDLSSTFQTMYAAIGRAGIKTFMGLIGGLFLFVLILVPLFFQLFFLPLHGNDPLEYMQLGRMFAEHRDPRLYPILTALPQSGFVAPWTHPPHYAILISLAFMIQGSSLIAGAAKMIVLWFTVGLAALAAALVYASDRRIGWRVWIAPAFVLSVPVFFELVQSAHIDGMRIAAFTAAVALGCNLIASRSAGAAALAGVGLAGAMLTHSIGILAPAIILPLLFVYWTGSLAGLVRACIVMLGVALLLGAPHYVRNMAIFGNPIQDNVAIWNIATLKVKEFVQISRGLETLLDRLYLGALMPWTRRDLFGVLPMALLLLAPLALFRSIWEGRMSLATAFARRAESLTTQIVVAILGFLALIFLSVFVGSELAVKNARYILTIVPLAVVAALLAAGVLIEDSRIARMAARIGHAILKILPGRFTPGWLRATVHDDNLSARSLNGKRRWMAGVADLAAVLVIGAIVLIQFQSSYRAAIGNTRIYMAGSVPLARLTESETMKRNGSVLGDAMAERATMSLLSDDAKVLLFRQASFGFYASGRFVFHVDQAVEHLFRIADAPSLHRELTALGLKWVLTPDFALPEINNSAFRALLMDGTLVRPEVKFQGWTLHALRDAGLPLKVQILAEVSPASEQGGPHFGTTEQGPGMVDGRRAGVRIDTEGGFVELNRQRGAIKQIDRWDALLSRPLRSGSDPHAMNVADWYFTGGEPVALSAVISGKGYADIVVEYTVHKPVVSAGSPMSGRDDLDAETMLMRETLWAGVLEERPKTVGGWILSPLSRLSNRSDRLKRGARIFFRLRDGDQLRVHRWTASSVHFPEQAERLKLLDTILLGGWSFTQENTDRNGAIELRLAKQPVSHSTSWDFPPVGIGRTTTRPAMLMTPSFWMPDAEAAEIERERNLLGTYLASGTLRLEITGSIDGFGKVTPRAMIYCGAPPRAPEGLLQTFVGSNTATENLPHVVSLPPVQFWGDSGRQFVWSEVLPCVPYRVRLSLTSEQQSLVVIEEFVKNPERARAGYVDVHDMQVTLLGGASTATRHMLPLRLRTGSAQ